MAYLPTRKDALLCLGAVTLLAAGSFAYISRELNATDAEYVRRTIADLELHSVIADMSEEPVIVQAGTPNMAIRQIAGHPVIVEGRFSRTIEAETYPQQRLRFELTKRTYEVWMSPDHIVTMRIPRGQRIAVRCDRMTASGVFQLAGCNLIGGR